jgi:predicted Zn-dependent protease
MATELLEKQYSARKLAQRQDELLSLAREALRASGADQTQVSVIACDQGLSRFAGSEIHQNTFERSARLAVTSRIAGAGGLQQAVATTNVLSADAARDCAARATAAARLSPANRLLADFPEGPQEYPFQVNYYEATAACTPEDRARQIVKCFDLADGPEYTAAGFLSTGQQNMAVINSRGIEAALHNTMASLQILWTGPSSSGKSELAAQNILDLDCEGLAVEALATAKRCANPRGDIEAGVYPVVLSASCVATLLRYLSWLGFSGRDLADGSSFMLGRMNEKIAGSQITIHDDALNPLTQGLPCDMAGVPRQRVALIESGVARGVVHDVNSAQRLGAQTTGHDSGANYPLPLNMVMAEGQMDTDEQIAGIRRGIYVNHFHYTNVIDPLNTVITGMTRDGVLLIEDGELGQPVTNFRFTQNILAALGTASGVSTQHSYVSSSGMRDGGFMGGMLVPKTVRLDEFSFSGKTTF